MQGSCACLVVIAALMATGCGGGDSDRRAVERAFHAYVVKAVTGDASLCDEVFSGKEPTRFVVRDRAMCRLGLRSIRQRVASRQRRAAARLKPTAIRIRGAVATVEFMPPDALRGWFSPGYFHKTSRGWLIEADSATKCANGDLSCPS